MSKSKRESDVGSLILEQEAKEKTTDMTYPIGFARGQGHRSCATGVGILGEDRCIAINSAAIP